MRSTTMSAADIYWQAAAEMDFAGPKERLVVKDADKFKLGIARFKQGQAKRFVAVGDTGLTAAAIFLSHTKSPPTDQAYVVNTPAIQLRRDWLLRDLCQWQDLRAAEQASEGNPTSALEPCWQNLHLIDQYEAAGISAAFDQMAMLCKSKPYRRCSRSQTRSGGNLDNSERQRIISARERAVLQQKIAERACAGDVERPESAFGYGRGNGVPRIR